MKKQTYLTMAALAALSFSQPALAGSGHDHGSHGHDHGSHAKEVQGHTGHDAHEGHVRGKAGDFTTVSDAIAALKEALNECSAAAANDKLEAIHEIYPRIEGAAAYVHDNAQPASKALSGRFHSSVDQLMGIVSEMHDTSHGLDKQGTERLLKKANGAVKLVENYLAASDRSMGKAGGHGHDDHGHAH